MLGFRTVYTFRSDPFHIILEYYDIGTLGEPFLKKVNQYEAIANTVIFFLCWIAKLYNILFCGQHIMKTKGHLVR